jgi:hypothetical protein
LKRGKDFDFKTEQQQQKNSKQGADIQTESLETLICEMSLGDREEISSEEGDSHGSSW